ncbi:MAG: aldo/keto reductase, partial [Campylobacterota bacterium]
LAVAWSKHFDFVASTIIGARTPQQLDDSFKAWELKLDKQSLNKIAQIQKQIMYPMG